MTSITVGTGEYEPHELIQFRLPDGAYRVEAIANPGVLLDRILIAIPGVAIDLGEEVPPPRALNQPWRPSMTRRTIVTANIRIAFPLSSAPQEGRVELRSDPFNPPVNARCRVERASGGGGINPALVSSMGAGVSIWTVPAGWWVSLVPVTVTGTPTYSIPNDNNGRPMVQEVFL